jgi:hypothetical protein
VHHEAYYSSAVQVIPILFFVIVLERRLFRVIVYKRRWLIAFEALWQVGLLFVFIGGELVAFNALETGHEPGWFGRWLVSRAIDYQVVLILVLGIGAVLGPLREPLERWLKED